MNKKLSVSPSVSLAACTLQVRPGDTFVRLIPAGQFDAPRGAMQGRGPWLLTEEAAQRIIRAHASRKSAILIDYEHQSLRTASNGLPAPASGWIDPTSLKWVADGDEPGLYGEVTWTAAAASLIDKDEYRYLSPFFTYIESKGAQLVKDLVNVALTNTPAIDEPVAAAMTAALSFFNAQQEKEVDLSKLAAALGLAADATEDAILAAIQKLQEQQKAEQEKADQEKATAAAEKEVAAATSAEATKAMAAMQQQIAALASAINADKAEGMIRAALQQGKLVPAQEKWARDLAKTNLAALSSYLETAVVIPALAGTQSDGTKQGSAGVEDAAKLTAEQLAVCSQLGLSPEDFLEASQPASFIADDKKGEK